MSNYVVDPASIVVLEYSPSQRAFHRHTLQDHIYANTRAMKAKRGSDFYIVYAFSSYDESDLMMHVVREQFARMFPETDLSNLTVDQILNGPQCGPDNQL